ncbi:MAG: T9SS type A sorting domain-containing protein, partial [Rhodothermales bacterium]
GSNELASLFYAGWYLDDVRIVVDRPQDVTPPSVAAGPDALMTAEAGRVPPPIVIQAHDNVGIDAVLAEYEIIPTSGTRRQDTLRLAMNTGNLTLFSGTIPAPAPFGVGDRIEYRLRLRDFDGNTTVYPGPGQPPLRIEYRLAERFSALGNARASGLWQRQDTRWTTSTEGLLEATSSLVLEPFDLPDNAEAITFTLTHSYRLGSELGGNLKLSLDEGTTWSLLDPEGSYSTPFAPVQAHPMSGEGVFTGPSPGTVETAFDLSDFGGRQVRLRLDFGAARAPDASERWIIEQAALAYTTGDTAFDIPRELALHPNFPDPFIDNTTLSYTLPERMPVRLELYNILGQRISVLVDGEQDAGTYTLTMGRGSLAGGVYILRMLAGSTQKIERMVISR